MELVTKEDLQCFRMQLLEDLYKAIERHLNRDYEHEWLKSADLRKMLRVSDGTLQNLRISGKLKPVKIEGTWYYNRAEVLGLFERRK